MLSSQLPTLRQIFKSSNSRRISLVEVSFLTLRRNSQVTSWWAQIPCPPSSFNPGANNRLSFYFSVQRGAQMTMWVLRRKWGGQLPVSILRKNLESPISFWAHFDPRAFNLWLRRNFPLQHPWAQITHGTSSFQRLGKFLIQHQGRIWQVVLQILVP